MKEIEYPATIIQDMKMSRALKRALAGKRINKGMSRIKVPMLNLKAIPNPELTVEKWLFFMKEYGIALIDSIPLIIVKPKSKEYRVVRRNGILKIIKDASTQSLRRNSKREQVKGPLPGAIKETASGR